MTRIENAYGLIAALGRARTTDELDVMMQGLTGELRFRGYALVHHVKHLTTTAEHALHNYPSAWIDHYLQNNLQAWDPVLRASLKSSIGFRFEDIPSLIQLSEREREFLASGREHGGITDGFSVPAHIPGQFSVSCTFVVLHGAPLPDKKNLLVAQLAGTVACEAARRVMWSPTADPSHGNAVLTARQLECVLLVGKGKTDWEIAQLLGINEETVTAHINESRRRYGVGRRAELPLHAVYRGDLGFGDILA